MTTTDMGTEGSLGRLTSEAYKHAQESRQTRALIQLMVDSAQRLGNGTDAAKGDLQGLLELAENMATQDFITAMELARRLEARARQNPGS